MKPTIITLTGPSCAGKSTLEALLKDKGMVPLMSTTTRKPRPGEVDGVHYRFITKGEFKRLIHQEAFIEHVQFGEEYYGLMRREVNEATAQGKPGVVVVEPQGRDQIVAFAKRHGWIVHPVWVDNPPEVIAERLLERFAQDLLDVKVGCSARSVVAVHAKRLAIKLDVEQEWLDETYGESIYPYRVLILEFNESNQDAVVELILDLVEDWQQEAA